MRLNLSWRHKLNVLMVATPVGLVLMVIVGIWALSSMSTSYRAIYQVFDYKDISGDILLNWNALEKDMSRIEPSELDRIHAALEELAGKGEALVKKASRFNDPEITSEAKAIADSTTSYQALRSKWLERSSQLGFTDDTGARGSLMAAIAKLQSLSIKALDEPVSILVNRSRQYLQTHDAEMVAQIRSALDRLDGVVRQYGWNDNVIGKTVDQFRQSFGAAEAILTAMDALEQSLAATGERLQNAVLEQNSHLQTLVIKDALTAAEGTDEDAKMAIVGTALALAPLLVFALVWISRTLVRRLDSAVKLLSRVSRGDLTGRLELGDNPRDEFNQLGAAANQMLEDIGSLLRESVLSTEALLNVRSELASTTERLNKSSVSVERDTEQAATATQEVSVTISDVARRAAEVGENMQDTNESAKTGESTIAQSIAAMQRLSGLIQDSHQHLQSLKRSSVQVTGIIDVIDGLAGQTNLLALNAAIEAARAGETGRGFSVVADEVRTLAQKTVSATNNISDIISELNSATGSIGRQMDEGVQAAGESAERANEISKTIAEIVACVNGLTLEMEQVIVAVEQVSAATESIAERVEFVREQSVESRAISQEIERQSGLLAVHAERLEASHRRFQIDGA